MAKQKTVYIYVKRRRKMAKQKTVYIVVGKGGNIKKVMSPIGTTIVTEEDFDKLFLKPRATSTDGGKSKE